MYNLRQYNSSISPSYSSFIPKALEQNFNNMLSSYNNQPKKSISSAFIQPQIQSQIQPQIQPQQTQSSNPIMDEVKKIDGQKLKYSMDRGEGCTDCSAFTKNVFKNAYGIDIGEWTGTQQNAGKGVPIDQRQSGDLVFFNTSNRLGPGGLTHVGIDNGDGTFTHFSSSNGGGVKTTPYAQYKFKPLKARRVI